MLEDRFKPIYHEKLDVYCWYSAFADACGKHYVHDQLYQLLDTQDWGASRYYGCKAYKTESAAYKDLDIAMYRYVYNFLPIVDYLPQRELEKLKEKICALKM